MENLKFNKIYHRDDIPCNDFTTQKTGFLPIP